MRFDNPTFFHHDVAFAAIPSEDQVYFYESKMCGFATHTPSTGQIDASLNLALWYAAQPDSTDVLLITTPNQYAATVARLRLLFKGMKLRADTVMSRLIDSWAMKLKLGQKLVTLEFAPKYWVAIGVIPDDPVPAWLPPLLLTVGPLATP